jgi:signal transduction histidine kinase
MPLPPVAVFREGTRDFASLRSSIPISAENRSIGQWHRICFTRPVSRRPGEKVERFLEDPGFLETHQCLRLLIVEDSEDDAEILRLELVRSGFDVLSRRVDTEASYAEAIATKPDVILADYTLPRFNALAALRLLQAQGLDIPFIVVTGSVGEERVVECMREGATDYLLKDRLARLGPAVSRALSDRRRREEQRQAEEERRLLELRLRQAQRMEAVGLLASGIAHDFNNVLTVISGQCHLLLTQGALEAAARPRIEEIDRAAERAASLTRQLLAFSRRQVLQPSVLELNQVLWDMKGMLTRILGEDIVIACSLAQDLGRVKADRGQIEQVIVNLAVNARDAMPRGGTLILKTANVEVDEHRARHTAGLKSGSYVTLSVSDRGEGMSDEVLSRIFEPFYTTKELGRGTGLGLSTVYGIVKQSEGFIEVSSEPGQGSTFEVLLPRVNEPLADPPEDPVSPGRGEGTILLVEDDAAVRLLIREILELSGYRVLVAASGRDAFGAIERAEGKVDLVVTDLVMPGMGGDEFARLLEARHPGVRVLYASGHVERPGSVPLKPRYRELIRKPFKSDELVRKVSEMLKASSL